ncbi:MAG: hypothetical protein IJP20_02190 [Clostridia bacterium]|nr:hypothetical protein [Clostridia bacterium]
MKTNRLIALVLVLIVAISLCITSCEDEKNKDLANLNKLAQKLEGDYTVSINVKSENGSISSREYSVKDDNGKKTVYAKIETLNKFDVSGGEITPPDSYSSVKEGYLSDADVSKGNFDVPKFSFSSSNISDVATTDGTLVGNVRSITELLGTTFDASSVKLTVRYSDTAINVIMISFTTSQNNTVTLTYTF